MLASRTNIQGERNVHLYLAKVGCGFRWKAQWMNNRPMVLTFRKSDGKVQQSVRTGAKGLLAHSVYAYGYVYIQWGMLQRRMLQRTNATYNCFINQIRMLQRTRRNTIGRRSTRLRMMCRAFLLWSERQSSSMLSFVRFSYQFSSVIFSV
jgi:hypothetical protein